MRSYKTLGLVLRRTNFGEADRVFTFLTPRQGKVEGVARGVRKLSAKLASHLEPFMEIELMLVKGKSLDVITSARQTKSFENIAHDYERMRRGFLFCEMLNRLTDQHTGQDMYQLLRDSLEALNAGAEPTVVELYFKLKLLDRLGYRPNLEQCMQSKDEIAEHKHYAFSSEAGGLVESQFAQADQPKIGQQHIKLWRVILEHPLAGILKIKNTQKPAAESLPIANDFYDYLFGKRFKSAEI